MQSVVLTSEVNAKLKTFQGGHYYTEFCSVLAERLTSIEITPLGFLLSFSLLCSDMEKGDGMYITGVGEPIRSKLSGMPLGLVMNMMLPKIIEHTFTPEVAEEVKRELASVVADVAKAQRVTV